MKVEFTLSTGFAAARRIEIFDYDDDVTDEELDEDWKDWIWNYIDGGPRRLGVD